MKLYFIADKSYNKARKSNSYLAVTNCADEAEQFVETTPAATHIVEKDVYTPSRRRK